MSGQQLRDDRPVRTTSLRHRVVFGVLALMLALLVGLGLVVNAVLRDRLDSDLHQRLKERAGLAQALAGQGLTDQALSDRLTGAGITASVSSGAGVVVGRDQPPAGPPGPGGPRFRPNAKVAAAVVVSQNGPRLSAQVAVDGRTVTVMTSTTEIDRTLATLQRIEFGAGGAALVLLALLLWRVVGAALAPLDRMTGLAHRIRDGARGRRLHPTRPGTELGRTAVAFDAMLDSLENAEAQAQGAETRMRRFLADASHDLRTPLAGVITTAERVLRDNPDRPAREERLVELIREAQRASRLVDDLLLMARLDARVAPRPVVLDLAALVRTATGRAGARHPSTGFQVQAPTTGPFVRADRDALYRVLGNLLDNAGQAGEGQVTISLRLGPGAQAVTVDVHDDGPGVAPQDRERIFDRFVRIDPGRPHRPSARSDGSSGLGLPIARALVRWSGGDVTYLDEPGGATFRVTLPAAGPLPDREGSEGQRVVVAAEIDRGRVVADV